MEFLLSALAWLTDPAHWVLSGRASIPARLAEHLGITLAAAVIAALIAVPLGAWIGHTGRFRSFVIGTSAAARAIPTLGLVVLLVTVLGPIDTRFAQLAGSLVALVVLAVPSLLAGTYAGIEGVEPAAVDAARAAGMTEWQILRGVELPLAAPLIIGGLRSGVLMIVATATIASFLGLGGLGAIIATGIGLNDYDRMLAGSLLVTALALALDAILALWQRAAARRAHPGG